MDFHLQLAESLATLLDNQFKIGKFRFGLDPVIGAIPGFGDLFTFALSFYIVWIGIRMQLPQDKLNEMTRNVIIDFVVGLIPVVGDLADSVYKANTKNLRIIKDYMKANRRTIVEGEIVT